MGLMTRTAMNAVVASIVSRTDQTTYINTCLQWAMDHIGGLHPWKLLTAEDKTSLVLAPSVQSYAIPTAFRAIFGVRVVDSASIEGRYLEQKEQDQFFDDNPYLDSSTEGRPTQWAQVGGSIYVAPVPGTDQTSLVTGTDSNSYYCKANHTAAAATCPITGASYATYWTISTSSDTAATWAADTAYTCERLYLHGLKWPTAFSGDDSVTDLQKTLDKAIIYLAVSYLFESLQEEETATYWENKALKMVEGEWCVELVLGGLPE